MPLCEVHPNTINGIRKRYAAAYQYDDHDNRETHGDVDDSPCDADTLKHAEPDEEPHESTPSNCLADEYCAWILGIGSNSAAACVAGDWVNVCDRILLVKFLSAARPRERTREG